MGVPLPLNPSDVPVICTAPARRRVVRSAKDSASSWGGVRTRRQICCLLGWAILPLQLQIPKPATARSPERLQRNRSAGTVRPILALAPVAAKRSVSTSSRKAAGPLEESTATDSPAMKPDQALALVGMGLMQKMAANGELPWIWNEAEDGGRCDVAALRQRLELTDLALRTGAPLSTAEITYLLGARPGQERVERGGLRARRVSRNVWKLSQASGTTADNVSFASFNDGRRRFA